MRFKFATAALLALGASIVACGGSAGKPAVTRTVDVSALTFADVQRRARAAATKPGAIFHLTDTQDGGGSMNGAALETWVDLERHVARVDRDGEVDKVIGPEKMALLRPDGRYGEALYSNDLDEPIIGFTLGYLTRIIGPAVESNGIEAAAVGGVPAIRVGVRQEVRGEGGNRIEKADIYLDEAFLPLKMELDVGSGARGRSTHVFRSEYVARDAVPAHFFSFEHVRAKAKTSEDVLRQAAKPFGRTYWFGEPFEGMVVESVNGMPPGDGGSSLNFTYGLPDSSPPDADTPFPCAAIAQYSKRVWDELEAGRKKNPDTANRAELGTKSVLGVQARMFEERADRVLVPPQIEGQPPPRIPTLAESSGWIAEIAFDDLVVELRANCGPAGRNPYRSLEGMGHLLDSLRVLEAE